MTRLWSPMLLYALAFLGLAGLAFPILLPDELGMAVASNATLAAGLLVANRYLSLLAVPALTSRQRGLRTLKVLAAGTAFFFALASIAAVRYGPVEMEKLQGLSWTTQLVGSIFVLGSGLVAEQIAMRLTKRPFGIVEWLINQSKWSKKGMRP